MKILKSLRMNGKKINLFFVMLACALCALFSCGNNKGKVDEYAIIIDENDTELLFGNYYRDADKWSHTFNPPEDAKSTLKKEALKWMILDKDEKKKEMLLVTKFAIDICEIDESKLKKDLNWSNSNLREYINNSLFNEIFDEKDKKSIVESKIKDKSNNNIKSEVESIDYMFLLSDEEVKKYNVENVSATNYASDKGSIYISTNCSWWLRSSALLSDRLCFVDINGNINYEGAKENARNMIRPAIKVKFTYKSDIEKNDVETKSDIKDIEGGVPVGLVGYEIDFGTYRFLENEKESIKWIVLDKDEKEHKALIISKYGLESKRFDSRVRDTSTWDNSELRNWLNKDFVNDAFTEDDKKYIFDTKVLAEDNIETGTYDGKDTIDKVFLLSLSEAKKYFANMKASCLPAFITNKVNQRDGVSPYGEWWLRTPGGRSGMTSTGKISYNKNDFNSFGITSDSKLLVRPCMWVKYVDKELVSENDGKARLIIGDKDSIVKFGKYYMLNMGPYYGDGLEDITWKVLYKDEEKKQALLVSYYAIDNIPYNDKYDMVTWENSYAREWLNNDFYNFAFSTQEKKKIVKSKISNYNYFSYEDGGNDTEDCVFLLSAEEALDYLDENMRCEITTYATEEKNAHYKIGVSDDGKSAYNYANYALRTPADNGFTTKSIHSEGYMIDGAEDSMKGMSIRPAIWVNYSDEKEDTRAADIDEICIDDIRTFNKDNFLQILTNLFRGKEQIIINYDLINIDDSKEYYEFDSYPLTDHYRESHDVEKPLYDVKEVAKILVEKIKEEDKYYFSDTEDEEAKEAISSYLHSGTMVIGYPDDKKLEKYFDDKSIRFRVNFSGENTNKYNFYFDVSFEVEDEFLNDIQVKLVEVKENKYDIRKNIDFVPNKKTLINNTDINLYSDGMLISKEDKIVEMGRYPQIRKIDEEKLEKFKKDPSKQFSLEYIEIEDDIKWIVLDYDEKEGKALLFSEKILDGSQFAEAVFEEKWSDSKLRKWLNNDFYDKAFTTEEKNNILETDLLTSKNYSKKYDDITNDKIFILSSDDIKNYYPDWKSRIGKLTSYAARLVTYDDAEKNAGNYWIRGQYQFVSGYNGNMHGEWGISQLIKGVRPAMWVKVNKESDNVIYKNFITYDRYESLINAMFDKDIYNYDKFPVTKRFKEENEGGLFKKFELNTDANYTYSIYVDKDKQAIKIYEYQDEYENGYYNNTYKTREIDLVYTIDQYKYIDEISYAN